MQDLDFASSDLAATEEFLVKAYTKMSIGGDSDAAHSRIARRWFGAVSFDELTFSYDMSYSADPLERICLCRVHAGHIEENFIGAPQDVFAPGDVTLVSPPELPYSGRIRAATYDLTMFDPAEFGRVATSGQRGRPVRLTGHRPVSAAAGARLHALIDYLRIHVLAQPGARTSALVEATATAHLAATVLNTFPNNAAGDATAADRNDARPILMRRAMAFVDDNAHTDISLVDIAVHIYVTPRTVQYMFRRHLDCTPMEYIRRVRVHHAHRELAAADPVDATVSAVAAKWGFAHTGRFAARYKRAYGRSPQATLRGA